MSNPIAGNQNFSVMRSLAGNRNNVNVTSGNQFGQVHAGSSQLTDPGTVTTVIGHTPSTWNSKGNSSNTSLNVAQNTAEATSSSLSGLLYIPDRAIIQQVNVENPSSTSLTSSLYAVGLASLSSSNAPNQAISATLMAATAGTVIDSPTGGAQVGGLTAITGATGVGTEGQTFTHINATGLAVPTGVNYITVNASTGPATGSLRVAIRYLNERS